jgi:hypothetical protein
MENVAAGLFRATVSASPLIATKDRPEGPRHHSTARVWPQGVRPELTEPNSQHPAG